eukprot:2183459-Prymnesium_polylepis.1
MQVCRRARQPLAGSLYRRQIGRELEVRLYHGCEAAHKPALVRMSQVKGLAARDDGHQIFVRVIVSRAN